MEFLITIGSLENKLFNSELEKVLKNLIKSYNKDSSPSVTNRADSYNINRLTFFCFELTTKDIKRWNLYSLEVNDINDLTRIYNDRNDLFHCLNASYTVIHSNSFDFISLDTTIHLEVLF